MPISNQKEDIDIRILRLIGLEDVFDLDYETYLTLLKEVMVKSRMAKKTIPTEEIELLTDEYKRVKSKKDSGRFEVKKKKISSGSFSISSVKGLIGGSSAKSLPGTAIGTSPLSKSLENNISEISASMVSISETLKQQKKIDDDASAYDKRKAEQEKRGLAENKLEKRFEGLKKVAEKIIAPVKSLLDKILQFFTTVILGRIVYKLVEWLGDEKNASKVKSIIRFVKDWWPALLGSYILFGTSFGKLVRGLTGTVGRFIFQIGKVAIPQLLKVISANPVASLVVGGAAAAGVGAYAASQQNEQKREGVKPGQGTPGSTQLQREQVLQRGLGGMFNGGGFVNGFVSGEKGVDKVPAMLSDGEFVMSRGAVAKYGVDTLEGMNAAGGGTNKPKIMSGTTYAQGGGMIGDIPLSSTYGTNPNDNTLRRAARTLRQFGTEEDLFKAFKKLNGVPDIAKMVGGENNYSRIFQGHHGADDALDAIRRSVAEKLKAVNNPQSFTQSSRTAAGLDDLAKKFDMDAKTAPRYGENLPRLGRPKPRTTRIDPSRMLPSAGESSANAMRAAAKASQNMRQPIPASRAIVPYTGAGLARTGITAGLSELPIQQIRTNMNVPGGRGRGGMVGTISLTLAEIFKPQIQKFVGGLYDKIGIGMGNLSDVELKKQIQDELKIQKNVASGPLGEAINSGSDRLSLLQQESERRKLSRLKGGKIVGGYGLKDQSFKDAPKTQIMTDDKGKPFVGYKAMRGGKIVYVRGPQTGTSNPLEMLGRMINPDAYKNIDAANARKKYDEAAKGSISSLKARGATQATISKRQVELNKRKPLAPPTKPSVRVVRTKADTIGKGGRGGGARASSKLPSFGASTKGSRTKADLIGVHR
jgi:hypothetical protein